MGHGKEQEVASLLPTPGLNLLLTLPGGTSRGIYTASDGEVYAVGGATLYSISPTWAATSLGTLNTSSGPVSFADNGTSVIIVDGSSTGYAWKPNALTFTTLDTTYNFQQADQVAYIDGYYIFNQSGSNKFFLLDTTSDINNLTVNGLDFAAKEGAPDALLGVLAANRELWLFGDKTTEVWYDSGENAFPFQRIEGAFIHIGISAKFSSARLGPAIFWLGKGSEGEGVVYMAEGLQPQRISTHAVEDAIQSYTYIGDAIAFTYQQDGHSFYVLNFPLANTTWAYDMTTGMWHERAYLNDGALERHRANCHAYQFGKHLVGDYANGNIYELSLNTNTDNGTAIQRLRAAPHLTSDLKRVTYHSLQLDIQAGVGIDGTGQGTDPQAMLQFSDDGGHTWSNEKWTSFGKIGATKMRAIWRRLGMSRDRVFRIVISDPVFVAIIGAQLEFEQEAS